MTGKNFEQHLNLLITNSELQIETVYYILKSKILELQKLYQIYLFQQKQEKQILNNKKIEGEEKNE